MARTIKLPKTVAKRAAELVLSKNAYDVCIVDLRKIKNAFAEYLVICSCDSDTQVRAVANGVDVGLKEAGVPVWHVEGKQVAQWMIVDCVDVVVHIFHRAARAYYNLERLWGDAPIERLAGDHDSPGFANAKKKPAGTRSAQ